MWTFLIGALTIVTSAHRWRICWGLTVRSSPGVQAMPWELPTAGLPSLLFPPVCGSRCPQCPASRELRFVRGEACESLLLPSFPQFTSVWVGEVPIFHMCFEAYPAPLLRNLSLWTASLLPVFSACPVRLVPLHWHTHTLRFDQPRAPSSWCPIFLPALPARLLKMLYSQTHPAMPFLWNTHTQEFMKHVQFK